LKNANLVSHAVAACWAGVVLLAGCGQAQTNKSGSIPPSPVAASATTPGAVARYTYQIVKRWPHDRNAFTQGLVYREGGMIESTGLNGRSSLREVQLETGKVIKQVSLPPVYFAEGVAVLGEQVFQLTWQNRKAFVYDVDTFQAKKELEFAGEGWGLATDGEALLLSDGTARIRFLDPATFAVRRTLDVTFEGKPRDRLNELEFIHGEIFANVWQTDEVVRIDPASGAVRGVIDFSGLLAPQDRGPETDVLNGIAYDAKSDRLFVTGKRWPWLFEVRLKAR
jgi:glutamine cyclotransferase